MQFHDCRYLYQKVDNAMNNILTSKNKNVILSIYVRFIISYAQNLEGS